jgi:hypothetical protein
MTPEGQMTMNDGAQRQMAPPSLRGKLRQSYVNRVILSCYFLSKTFCFLLLKDLSG